MLYDKINSPDGNRTNIFHLSLKDCSNILPSLLKRLGRSPY